MTHPFIAMIAAALLSACQAAPAEVPQEVVGKPVGSAAEAQRANIWYRLSYDGGDRIEAAVRLHAPPDRTRFFMPGAWAGRDDFDEVIAIGRSTSPSGPVTAIIDRRRGTIDVETNGAPWVELQYSVELSDRSPFHAQVDGDGVLVAFAPTLLVLPAQQILRESRDTPIEVVLPTELDAIATWTSLGSQHSRKSAGRRVHRFIAADPAALRDAYFAAGAGLRIARSGEPNSADFVEVAFSPTYRGAPAQLAGVIRDTVGRYRARFGSSGPVHVYVRTRARTGQELSGAGRRGGFVVDLPPAGELDETTRLLVAHEAFHMWNGHMLVPSEGVEESTRWFKEGVTHYVALKYGGFDEEFVLRELVDIGAAYAHNPLAQRGVGNATDRRRLPYDLGALVALGFDAQISSLSRGNADISCWILQLLSPPRTDIGQASYDEQTLLEALHACVERTGARDANAAWRRWIREREPISLRALFGAIGLHWLPPTADRPGKLVPLDGKPAVYRQLFGTQE